MRGEQIGIQYDLHHVLNTAADWAGLDRRVWERQVGGDGELAVLPADTDALRLVADFPRELAHALAVINGERAPQPRIRLRTAIHHGTLAAGCLGPVGQAPIVVSRLLDSDDLRAELAQRTGEDLVLIVSASLYADVIETGLANLDPAEFFPVKVQSKSVTYPAFIRGRGA